MADQTPLLSDGLLGWPGFGPGGSQQWKVQRLYTGDIWYAPRSGFYLIAGCGGGGGGGATAAGTGGGGGGSGATLCLFPLYLPESSGGVVTIGAGGTGSASPGTGNNGGNTSLGTVLILGGGTGGNVSGAGGATGAISGFAKTISGEILTSQGSNGESAGGDAAGYGGSSFVLGSALTTDVVSDFLSGRLRISHGGRGKGINAGGGGSSGNSYGAGGGGGYASTGGNGADGCLIIAWVGTI